MRGIINQPNQTNRRQAQNPWPPFAFFSAPGTHSSALRHPRRFGVVIGSKTVDSMSVQGCLSAGLGSVLCRFGVGLFTRKKLLLQHKYRPDKYLSDPGTVSVNPNTIFARTNAPKTNRKTPTRRLKHETEEIRPPSSGILVSRPSRICRMAQGQFTFRRTSCSLRAWKIVKCSRPAKPKF